jgi:hypothetical protein
LTTTKNKKQPMIAKSPRTLLLLAIFSAGLLCITATTAFQFQPSAKKALVNSQRNQDRQLVGIHTRQATNLYVGSDAADEGNGGLLSMGSELQSRLVDAFTALDESDKYDAVLTGLCAKVLDDSSKTASEVVQALEDPIQLLQEMNQRRVRAGARSLMSLIDAAVISQDAKMIATIISIASNNGGISNYGKLQTDITPLPSSATSKVRCPDGSMKTREDRLAALPDIPTDERNKEVTSAVAVAGIVGFCGAVNVLGLEPINTFTNPLWILIVLLGVVDNFYDLIKFGVKSASNANIQEFPEKLPLGIGSGQLSGSVVKGFNRLLVVDTERECECEAAAFFAAYALGLPVFSFQPNAFEAAVLVAESNQNDNDLDPLLTNNGIMKMLVWLMAPVAMEKSKHAQLVFSDPREAAGLLSRLESSDLINKSDIWWTYEVNERMDMIKWAYAEADSLLRNNRAMVKQISDRLTSGASTVGDCVAVIEGW